MSRARSIAKCVILARGLGTRMRRNDVEASLDAAQSAAADVGLKAMIPVGRPFLDYVLSAVADEGFTQICLVIGPEHHAVQEYYSKTVQPQRVAINFADQSEPRGTADAVLAARKFAGTDEFLVINSDNYYPADALDAIQALGQPGTVLFDSLALVRESNIPPARIRAFAHCLIDANGFLADIVERPENGSALDPDAPKLVSMNCWRFGPDIFTACRQVPLSPRGEYELPLAVKLAIQQGAKFKAAMCHSGVLDLSRRSDIAAVAERLRNVGVRL